MSFFMTILINLIKPDAYTPAVKNQSCLWKTFNTGVSFISHTPSEIKKRRKVKCNQLK
jgi:hypothetical protein